MSGQFGDLPAVTDRANYPAWFEIVATFGPGLTSTFKVPLSQFPLLEDNTIDPAAVNSFLVNGYASVPTWDVSLHMVLYGDSTLDIEDAESVTHTVELLDNHSVADGWDVIASFLGFDPITTP